MPTLDKLRKMTGAEIKEYDRRMVLYLLKCYPNCADEKHEDHAEFIDDMTDILLARLKG